MPSIQGPLRLSVPDDKHAWQLEVSHLRPKVGKEEWRVQGALASRSSRATRVFFFSFVLSPFRPIQRRMRRLLGFKDKKAKGEKDEKENKADRSPPPAPTKQMHDLGLSLSDDDDDSPATRTSRHVAFASSSSPAPLLQPQPSFESRHGTGAGASCFPRATSTPSETTERPGQPKPVRFAAGYEGLTRDGKVGGVGTELSNQGHRAWSPALGMQRTTSPLSLAPSGRGSYADSRSSPYLVGAHSSLGVLAERDPSQIYGELSPLSPCE